MADRGEIIIKFEKSDGSNNPSPVNIAEPKNVVEENGIDILGTAAMIYCLKKSANFLKNVTIEETKYQLNKYFTLTNNYLAQQNMSIALNVIGKSAGFITSVVAGAKVAGPIGAATMAIINIAQTAIEINHNYEQERLRLNKMNADLSWNRQRAGYSLTAGSVGENR